MNKIEAAIEFIKAGDSIYQDYLSHFSSINFELMAPDERRRKVNQYAILYAQIAEYYLKALILPDLKNDNYVENTDDEMNFIANDSSGLKRYNHIFKRIMFDSAFDSEIRDRIVRELANNGKYFSIERKQYLDELVKGNKIIFPDFREYGAKILFSIDNTDNNQKLSNLLDKILNLNTGAIAQNSDAYPKSRYAMIDNNGYTACLEFLIDFTNAIRETIEYKIKNCIRISGCDRRIFPDLDTEIKITFDNGNSDCFYFDSSNNLWITDANGTKIDTIGYIWNYDMQLRNQAVVDEVLFFENGQERRLKLDKKTGDYTFVKCIDKKENNLGISKR